MTMKPLASIPHVLPKGSSLDKYEKIYIVFDWDMDPKKVRGKLTGYQNLKTHCNIIAIGTKRQIERTLNQKDFPTYQGGLYHFRFVEISYEAAYEAGDKQFIDQFDSGILCIDDAYREVDEETGKEYYFHSRKFAWVPNGMMYEFDFDRKLRDRRKKAKKTK
jgi:hypothetical protein